MLQLNFQWNNSSKKKEKKRDTTISFFSIPFAKYIGEMRRYTPLKFSLDPQLCWNCFLQGPNILKRHLEDFYFNLIIPDLPATFDTSTEPS